MQKRRILLASAGAVLVVAGALWMAVIYPRLERIPADFERTVELDGTLTVVDQQFTTRLQSNETIKQLSANPQAAGLLADAGLQAALKNPALGSVIGDSTLRSLIADPTALATLTSPEVGAALANKDLIAFLSDPAVVQALQAPGGLQQLAAHPVGGKLLADPHVAAVIGNPAVQKLVASGAVAKLVANPAILGLFQDPGVKAAVANPMVQALLADPESLTLVLDARTQKILANPAELPVLTVPVVLHRVQKATGTDGEALLINEKVSYLHPQTKAPVPGFEPTELNLVVHRVTREYLDGSQGGRKGQFGLPFKIDTTRTYPSWVTAAGRPLDATYVGVEVVNGLNTYRHSVKVDGLDLGRADPATGLPLVFESDIVVFSEPRTGSSVKVIDVESVSAVDKTGRKYPRFDANLTYTDETVQNLVEEASSARLTVIMAGQALPVAVMLAGVATALVGLMWKRKPALVPAVTDAPGVKSGT